MKATVIVFTSLLLACCLVGSLSANGQCVFSNGQPTAIASANPYNPAPLLPAILIDSFVAPSEYDWSLNADFAWGNVFDTNDITAAHKVTEVQFYANPTLGVTYEFYMTTDAGGYPDDANLTLLASRSDLDGGGTFDWVTVDVAAAGYEVQPGQVYWFVRTCPIGGWPGFTWSSATELAPPHNPPVQITQSFPAGGWGGWVADWWMLFRIYGDPSVSDPTLAVSDLVAGQVGTFTFTNGTPNTNSYLAYSLVGTGSTYVPLLNVTLGLAGPKQGGSTMVSDPSGTTVWNLPVPNGAAGRNAWLQAAQYGVITNVVQEYID